ncbi:MAG: hypothetical protein A2X86_09235 [Bdellovibrionales bacterium GWA2_49_15]|nr:MAG: hypothetical protein A2X86_09235 [Bdellovibrionales bacterium GWA2_49_15]HAZ12961.1 hypothetical protein [Bdellovibrionales bacterium]
MEYLEKIKPSYVDLLMPLKRWKILDVKALKEASEYSGSFSGFYKIVAKLEKNLLLDSFTNSWSNEKFVYLSPNGLKALGENERGLGINRDTRFHDSIVSKVARFFAGYSFVKDVYLDFQIKDAFPLLERVPDCLLVGALKSPFKMAIEVELTQKSQERVTQIYRTYSDSKVVNQILYITDKQSIFDAYKEYFNQGGELIKEKFLFLLTKDLSKGRCDLKNEPVYFRGSMTSLSKIFGNPMHR